MKRCMLAALAAAVSFAQEPSPAPAKAEPIVIAKGSLTPAGREKFLRLQATYAAIAAAKDAEKRLALQPIELEFEALRMAECAKLGISKKDVASQCVIDSDEDKGDGSGEVRWEKPAETPAAESKTAEPAK